MPDVLIDLTVFDTPSRLRGIGRYVRGLCDGFRALRATGELADVDIVGLTSLRGDRDDSLTYAGAERQHSALDYQRHKLARRLFLGRAIRRSGARLVHLPDPPGTPIDNRVPKLVTCHDLIPLVLHDLYARYPGGRRFQELRALARYRTATRVLAISEHTKRDLIEHLGMRPETITVVPHGVEHERFHDRPEPDEQERVAALIGSDAPYFICLGGADPRKNLPALLAAYAASDVAPRLVLGGAMSERQRGRIEAVIAQHGLGERVTLLGYVDEALVPALFRQANAHLFPSCYEGFGLPILEAMACGAPTLCQAASASGEVAGDAALIVADGSVDAWARALQQIEAPDLRDDLRRRGLAHARRFTWTACARATAGVYREMLS